MLYPSLFMCLISTGVQGLPQGNPLASAMGVAGDDLPAGPDEEGQLSGVVDNMTVEDIKKALPQRDPANAQNWYRTSLSGFNGCGDKDKTWREKMIKAYSDANELIKHQDLTENLDANSATALQCLGPSRLNKGFPMWWPSRRVPADLPLPGFV